MNELFSRNRQRGFALNQGLTSIELVIVLVVLGILMTSITPVVSHLSELEEHGAAMSLASHLSFAQSTAITEQRTTWVFFDTSADTYSIQAVTPSLTLEAVADPLTQSDLNVDLSASGLDLVTASFGSGDAIGFLSTGVPIDEDSNVLTASGTLAFARGTSLTIWPETGAVEIDP